jgi:hypothetical protein
LDFQLCTHLHLKFGSLETPKFQLIMSASEDPLHDSLADFLDELGAPESPKKSVTATATTELIDALLEDTTVTTTDIFDTPQKERRDSVTKEIPKAAIAKELSRTTSPKVTMNRKTTMSSANKSKSKPSVRAKAKQQVMAAAPMILPPKSSVTPTRGGLTMYERSMLQMEEREQRLKALQDKLSADCTFTPNSTGGKASSPNTGGGGGMNVYDRLFHSETKPNKKKYIPRSQPRPRSRSKSADSMKSTNTKSSSGTARLDEMYQRGQHTLRSRTKTDKEEEQARRRRMEEELLGQCTFQPKTKWNLAKEQRKKAYEVAPPSPGDIRRTKLSVSLLEEL